MSQYQPCQCVCQLVLELFCSLVEKLLLNGKMEGQSQQEGPAPCACTGFFWDLWPPNRQQIKVAYPGSGHTWRNSKLQEVC